jgi:hypothetical protein
LIAIGALRWNSSEMQQMAEIYARQIIVKAGGGCKRTLQGKAPPSRQRRQGGRQKSQLPCSCLLAHNKLVLLRVQAGGVGSARNIRPREMTFSGLRLAGYFPSRASI